VPSVVFHHEPKNLHYKTQPVSTSCATLPMHFSPQL
jgi:hypothetical protein